MPPTPRPRNHELNIFRNLTQQPQPTTRSNQQRPHRNLLHLQHHRQLHNQLYMRPSRSDQPIPQLHPRCIPTSQPPKLRLPNQNKNQTSPNERLHQQASTHKHHIPIHSIIWPQRLTKRAHQTFRPNRRMQHQRTLTNQRQPLMHPPKDRPSRDQRSLQQIRRRLRKNSLRL